MTVTFARVLLAAAIVSGITAGCSFSHASSGADKAGGSNAPTVLSLADAADTTQPDTPAVRFFAAQVRKVSHGALRIQITYQAAGDKITQVEQRTVQKVQDGTFDLGWVGARAWDQLGVTSFEALQAPFLVTSYPLLDRVVTSGIADKMLDGLRSQRVIGLALIPDELRQPVGLKHPLVSLSAFSGARVRIQPSRVTSSLMRALGATPVEVANAKVGSAIERHRIDGEELALGNAPTPSTVTGNVTFFGKTLTLFAGGPAYEHLNSRQRDVLTAAAKQTLQHVIATSPTENALAAAFCRQSAARIAFASKSQRAALVRAAQPVYAELERNAETKSFIAKIRRLRTTTPAPPPLVVPPSCTRLQRAAAATGKLRSPSILNGTYHIRTTIHDELKFGPPASDPGNLHAGVETRVLRNGRWEWAVGEDGEHGGTYSIRGNRITFGDGPDGKPEWFVFSLDRDGTLHLKPVLPMDPGDQWVTAGEPWQRVGPPRPIP
jgi:TRAP-type C4-dicarboxylate transport system substrate-binding protein